MPFPTDPSLLARQTHVEALCQQALHRPLTLRETLSILGSHAAALNHIARLGSELDLLKAQLAELCRDTARADASPSGK